MHTYGNNLKALRVRKLTGQTSVPYNRGLRVRGSPHPCFERVYEAVLSPVAVESNAFRIQSELDCPDLRIASLICFPPSCRWWHNSGKVSFLRAWASKFCNETSAGFGA